MNPEFSVRFLSGLAFGLFCSAALHAEPGAETAPAPVPAVSAPEIGATTANLLELQRSGLAAGKTQPIGGDVAARSYKRYLDSFERPIPEARDNASGNTAPATGKSGTTTGSSR